MGSLARLAVPQLSAALSVAVLAGPAVAQDPPPDPIEGTWHQGGGDLVVTPTGSGTGTFQGRVMTGPAIPTPTAGGDCAHPRGAVIWPDLSRTAERRYRGTHPWYRRESCAELARQPAEFEIAENPVLGTTLTVCSNSPEDGRRSCVAMIKATGADSDEDGLQDSAEEAPVDTDGDGSPDLDLPAMGADPEHKDLFVELDFMPGFRMTGDAQAGVRAAFAAAPVGNPDGTNGIRLHLDHGPDSLMDPRRGRNWGTRSSANEVPSTRVLGRGSDSSSYSWSAFLDLKRGNFPPEREYAFRYAVSANRLGSVPSPGLARGIPSADFALAFGRYCSEVARSDFCPLTRTTQGGIFMHELGHTLGLSHGGHDSVGFKPNHLSVMNYTFQLTGIPLRGFRRSGGVLDYQRFTEVELPRIDERSLDEGRGLPGAGGALRFGSTFFCPGSEAARVIIELNRPVDWNCNRRIDPGRVSANVNGTRTRAEAALQELFGYLEWNQIQFLGGAIGVLAGRARGAQLGPPPSSRVGAPPDSEPSMRLLERVRRGTAGDRRRPSVSVRIRRGRVTVRARDDRAIESVLVELGKRQTTVRARRSRSRSITVKRRLGRARSVRAMAVDRSGNYSRAVRRRVRRR